MELVQLDNNKPNKMIVKFKKLNDNAVIPTQGTALAGGWDVTATDMELLTDGRVVYRLGFALEIPDGYRLRISPRSSFTKTAFTLQNSPCLIDADYRGELMIVFRKVIHNGLDNSLSPYKVGERIGQCYLEKIIPIEFEIVEELSDTIRGVGGYGSTGK